jgi:hypothetical protein
VTVSKTRFKNTAEIRQEVVDSDGLVVVEARRLMDATGWERWTMNAAIVRKLRNDGLDVLEVPVRGDSLVRIFVPGSPVARLVEAVLRPSTAGDDALRRAARGDTGVLDQIRALLGVPEAS